jgi:class 3 adenylate cyclase/pimeloyl-ACP methyl ester carboxylesterase
VDTPRPNIRFTRTSDGVEIGFWEIGSGPPLVLAQNRSLSHAELEWEVPSMAGLYLELAEYFRLVRFDPRGAGISADPPGDRVDHEGLARDIGAVIDALEVGEVNLVGAISLGPAAVQHAVDRPDSITRLVLCDTGPVLGNLPLDSYVRATDALLGLGVTPSLGGLFPATPTADLPALERLMRGSLYNRLHLKPRDLRFFDVTAVLDRVAAPTLVLKSQDSLYTDLQQTRILLSGIPGSEMRVVPGTMAPWLAERGAVVGALVSFLTSTEYRPSIAGDEGTLTIVFTDLVSSTSLIDREGDESALQSFREIQALVSELAARHGGRVIKRLGDGSLLTFTSTRKAIMFSLELQDRMTSQSVQMRIGMAAGEPITDGDDIHGAAVVRASRIADLGGAGEVLVSDGVRQLAAGKGFEFQQRGDVRLKGFEEEERVWRASRPKAAERVVAPETR